MIVGNAYFKDAQDHLPVGYATIRGFLSESEVDELNAWFASSDNKAIKSTLFTGEDQDDADNDDDEDDDEDEDDGGKGQQPHVRQLYGNPGPFEERFPLVFERVKALIRAFAERLGVNAGEAADVTFAQDIRHITYSKGDECTWHRDDPRSHFNTIFLLSHPHRDFEGGALQFHPHGDPTPADLGFGDAVIYAVPRMDHAVSTLTEGTRRICLVEMRRPHLTTTTRN
eukprot:m.254830 g.254830  ORF g.254830 m.254830 type:complete len:227 (-) comp19151_c1_seq1:256-936(-)